MVLFTDYLKVLSAKKDGKLRKIFETHADEKVSEQSKQKTNPSLVLELKGQRSLLGADDALRVPITFECIQCLILQSLIGRKTPKFPTWCNISNTNSISNVTVVIIDGWDLEDLFCIMYDEDEPPIKKRKTSKEGISCTDSNINRIERKSGLIERVQACLPFTSKLFPLKFEVTPSLKYSDEPIVELFSCIHMSSNVVSAIKEKYRTLREAAKHYVVSRAEYICEGPEIEEIEPVSDHELQFNRLNLLLSFEEMMKFKYPLMVESSIGKNSNYVRLHSQYDQVTQKSPMFAIDCEMCRTTVGSELTRISVVDENLNVIYTSFVKPKNKIVCYLTRFSGVTPHDLKMVTTSLTDVQRKLREILPKDCILVGHSLENDLAAMKLVHPYVIDTALIYNLTSDVYQRSSLKTLAKKFLQKDIQCSFMRGHDPSEDATASMELTLLKLRNGISFGDVNKNTTKNGDLRINITEHHSFNKEKNVFQSYESTVPEIIRLDASNSSFFITNNAETKCLIESYQPDWCQLTEKASKTLEIELESHEVYRLVVRHCQVPDVRRKSMEKLRKKLRIIDKKLSTLHSKVPENTLLLTLFTKKSDFTAPEGRRSKNLLLLDLKGQDLKSLQEF